MPVDLAYEANGERREISIEELPSSYMYKDIGRKTIAEYQRIISEAGTLFVNGPAGVYEEKLFEEGTRAIWKAIAAARGYSVIGGGDTVSAAAKFVESERHQLCLHRRRRDGATISPERNSP